MHFTATHYSFAFLLFMLITCILVAPFGKVEESFPNQALHDFLFLRTQFSNYDHHTFPPPVERTFLASFLLAIMASPVLLLLEVLDISLHTQKWVMLYTGRIFLAVLVAFSHWKIAKAFPKRSKPLVPLYFLLTAVQFYSVFWTTRMLPNNPAFILSNLALASFLRHLEHPQQGHWKRFSFYMTVASAIFRVELILFSGCIFLQEYLSRRLPFLASLRWITLVFGITVPLSMALDSFVWGYTVLPELQSFVFNVYHHKSSLWGVAPFYAYFAKHLPKLLGAASVFLPFGLRGKKTWSVFLPAFFFVFLYSLLPHKEARFISYSVPYLTWVAVHGWPRLPKWLTWPLVGATLVSTLVSIYVSIHNYPGGVALHALTPTTLPGGHTGRVFLDNYVAQTGAARFLEHPALHFDKLTPQATSLVEWDTFAHGTWHEAHCVTCFKHLAPLHAWPRQGPFVFGPCVCLVSQWPLPDANPPFEKWARLNGTVFQV